MWRISPEEPAVVVGDESGLVYSFNLATGARGWTYNAGAPVNSSPSVAATTPGSALDSVFVGSGDAAVPTAGGYQAISPSGGDQWFVQETNPSSDPTTHNGVQASLAVGDLQGGNDVTAGSLGQNQDALNASNGALLTGFPWFEADSNFTTPALADLYSNGTTEIVEGGDSTAGVAYGQNYVNGGHLRILSPAGNAGQAEPNGGLDCEYDTNETVESSPAVGEFFGSSQTVGIVFGTGATYHTSRDQSADRRRQPLQPRVVRDTQWEYEEQPGPRRRARQWPTAGRGRHRQRLDGFGVRAQWRERARSSGRRR